MITAKFQASVPQSRKAGRSFKLLPWQFDKGLEDLLMNYNKTRGNKWANTGLAPSLSSKRSLPVMVSLLFWRHSGVLNVLRGDARLCRWRDAVSVELNIARTKHEHPFSSTHKGISSNCAVTNLLLTWCHNSCMYSSSAVDLTAEGLPRAERAHAHACLITYKHDSVAVSVICYILPSQPLVWTLWPCLCRVECWTWFASIIVMHVLFMCPIYSRTGASSCSDKDTGTRKYSRGQRLKVRL